MPIDSAWLFAGLTEAQRQAVLVPPGPLLVLAGAGAGKTRVLTRRVAHWIAAGTCAPGQVLAITFTNRAAGELAARLAPLLGPDAAGRVTTGTLHAVCHRLLRSHAAEIGRTPRFSIWDDGDRRRALRAVARELAAGLDVDAAAPVIGLAKARLLTPERLSSAARGDFDRQVAAAGARTSRCLQAATRSTSTTSCLPPCGCSRPARRSGPASTAGGRRLRSTSTRTRTPRRRAGSSCWSGRSAT